MDNDKIVVGLDIGTTKVCAIVGKLNELGSINILGFGTAESEGVRRGVIDNIDKTVTAIRKAVSDAEKHANVEINVVNVGIAGEHIRSMQHKGIITLNDPNREIAQQDVDRLREDMYKIAVTPGNEILHVIPQDYTVDGNTGIKDPVGMFGVRLEGNFHIVTCQSAAANNIYRCVRRAGLEVEGLVLQPLASSYSVLTDEEMEEGVCLIDIGGGTTDVIIFEDRIIRHTAVIPFGGNIITDDIKVGCSVMRKQAEYLKTNFGVGLASEVVDDEIITISGLRDRPNKEIRKRTLASVIQARMEEIIELVTLEIKNAGYHDPRRLAGGIVVTGGGGILLGIEHLVGYVTGIDARVGKPTEYLAKGMVAEVDPPMYATCAGLVIYGLKTDIVEYQLTKKVSQEAATKVPVGTETVPALRESNGFMRKVKAWFESSLNNVGNTIE